MKARSITKGMGAAADAIVTEAFDDEAPGGVEEESQPLESLRAFRGRRTCHLTTVDAVLLAQVVDAGPADPEIIGDIGDASPGGQQVQDLAPELRRVAPSVMNLHPRAKSGPVGLSTLPGHPPHPVSGPSRVVRRRDRRPSRALVLRVAA